MTRPLELRVLVAVNDGHQTLDALTRVLGEPAEAVDQRIRWLINERLLVPYQHGDTWTFDVTDAGQRMLAMRSRLDEVAGGSAAGSAGTGPAVRPGRWPGGAADSRGPEGPARPGSTPGPGDPTGRSDGGFAPGGSLGATALTGIGGLAGVARSLFRSVSGEVSSPSRGGTVSSGEPAAPFPPGPGAASSVDSPSGASHLLSPTEEAQRAERAAWWFAVSVVGALVAVVLIVWVLATA